MVANQFRRNELVSVDHLGRGGESRHLALLVFFVGEPVAYTSERAVHHR